MKRQVSGQTKPFRRSCVKALKRTRLKISFPLRIVAFDLTCHVITIFNVVFEKFDFKAEFKDSSKTLSASLEKALKSQETTYFLTAISPYTRK